MTILLPHVMSYNLCHSAGDYAALLPWLVGMDAAMSTPAEKRAEAAITAIEELGRKLNAICGLPLSLSEAGVSKDAFAKVSEFAVNDGALIVNPRAASEDEVMEILNAAY